MSDATLRARFGGRLASPAAEAARDQAAVATGQLAAGAGNLAFSLVAARVLAPGSFAQMVSFLALYTLLGAPGASLSAYTSLSPEKAARLRRALLALGAAAGAGVALSAPVLGPALRLPVAMVVVLGLSGPSIGALAVERGRLYGERGHGRLAASLAVEPAVRLTLGVAMAVTLGAVGGTFGVVVAGYAALELARRRGPLRPAASRRPLADERPEDTGTAGGAVVGAGVHRRVPAMAAAALFLLVVVQNQDRLFANRLLSPSQAGEFAVVATLGGIAAFATMTIPLVLLPRAARGHGGLLPAVALAGALGGVPLLVALADPGLLVAGLFGARYAPVEGVVAPYLLGMGLLGVARVLAARRCAEGLGISTALLLLGAAALQAGLITAYGTDPRGVVLSTLAATSSLTVALGTAVVWRLPATVARRRVVAEVLTRPASQALIGISAVSLAVRFVVPRGLWLDEVTSVFEARQAYGTMLRTLRTADVHPPLYFTLLWATIRVLGSGDLAVRVPSILAGAAVVPLLYLLGKEAYDRRTGMIAAVLGAPAPFLVWYAQDARMYSLLMLFGVLALWGQLRVLHDPRSRLGWVAYALSSAGLAWTQYFGILLILVQQVAFVAYLVAGRHDRERTRAMLRGYVASMAVLVVAAVPLVPFAYHQFVTNQNAGRGFGAPQQVTSAAALDHNHLGVYAILANLIWALVGYHSNKLMLLLGALWPLGMLAALLVLGRRHTTTTRLLLAAFIGPLAVIYGLGLVKENLFDARYLSAVIPVLFVLIARGITGIAANRRVVVALTGVLVVVLAGALVDEQINGSNPRRYDFRGALRTIGAQAGPGDVLVFDPPDLNEVVAYYAPRIRAVPLRNGLPEGPIAARAGARTFVLASRQLMGPGNMPTLRRELVELRQEGERQVEVIRMANVLVWVYR